jgi:hypothetical protein
MTDSLFPYHASFYPDVDEPIPSLGVICNRGDAKLKTSILG